MHMSLVLFALTSLCFLHAVSAQIGPTLDLAVANREIAPDGFSRQAVVAGGQFPGPIIRGNKGDNFQINVHNQLTISAMYKTTTIHWHGILQHHTNWADGPAFVTQCPIAPGNSFLYNFTVHDQVGTYWYHSHESLQYCDGLRGPFIIYDPDDPHRDLYDIDDESTVITLSDWYHQMTTAMSGIPVANSTLINGLGHSEGDGSSPLAVVLVEQGKRYRFRLISMACHPYFNFTIDGHDNLTIIEADGQNTEPLAGIDLIPIFAAQRYSFILDANQPIDNYWIHAVPEQVLPAESAQTPQGLAILRYVGAPDADPTVNPDMVPHPKNVLFEPNLHAYGHSPVPELDPDCAECDLTLDVTWNATTDLFLVNGVAYTNPTVPVLLQILSGTAPAQALMPTGSVYTLPRNKTIQITMPGGVLNIDHPLHLHGHAFHVLRSAGSDVVNVRDPVRRDTVNIGNTAADHVTIRFVTDNPGPWLLHCHIDFHLTAGFAVVLAEGSHGVADDIAHIPPAWDELCSAYYALPSGDDG